MKRMLMMMTTLLLVLALPAEAARKACDELKQEIAAKIDANGVKSYSLDVIAIVPWNSIFPAWFAAVYEAGPKYVPPLAVVRRGQAMVTRRPSFRRL